MRCPTTGLTGHLTGRIALQACKAASYQNETQPLPISNEELVMLYVKPEEVTMEFLTQAMTNAAFEVIKEENENVVYVKGGAIGCWVELDTERKMIRIKTWYQCKEDAPLEELDHFANICNSSFIFVQFWAEVVEERGYLNATYDIHYNFGLIPPQFIYSIKKLTEIARQAITEKDPDDIFFT